MIWPGLTYGMGPESGLQGPRIAARGTLQGCLCGHREPDLAKIAIEAASAWVFNPHAQLSQQIKEASKSIAATFSEIDSQLDKGKSIARALQGRKFTAAMHRGIASARMHGFLYAANHSKKMMPANYGYTVRSAAEKRAAAVNRMMRRTSKKVLKNTPDSEFVLSKDRALMAARYEIGNAYFQGVSDAFKGAKVKKKWLTTSANPCDDCIDNESAKYIPIDQPFPSGAYMPLQHQHCQCWIAIKVHPK